MKKHTHSNQYCPNPLIKRFLLLITLASLLSSCGTVIQAPTPTDTVIEITPTIEIPTTKESTLIPGTKTATETDPIASTKIDMEKIVFPPMGDAKDNFEKGEYDASVEKIQEWVRVWGRMGVFDGVGDVYDNGLVLVPLTGTEKVTCVALRSDKYANTLFCPPMDNNIGGLKIIPGSGQEQDTDKPIIVELMGTEGLTTRGKGIMLTYQIADKYTNKGIRYYDFNAKGFVEGSFIAPLEVKENEPIEGSVVCVADEFCMGGQMKIDEELAPRFYDRFMNALVNNEENREYFNEQLSGNLSLFSLKKYLIESGGIIPPGLKLMKAGRSFYFRINHAIDRDINLNALKVITFGPIEWKNNLGNIQEYINSADPVGLNDPIGGELPATLIYYGWFIDSAGYIVLVSGSKDFESNYNEGREDEPFAVLGGKDGKYIPERDNMIATATFLSWVKFLEISEGRWADIIAPLANIPGGQVGATYQDVVNFFGNGTLFVK